VRERFFGCEFTIAYVFGVSLNNRRDSTSRVNALDEALAETPCGSILGVVLHNLPGRQVNDEAIPSESIETYKTTFIDSMFSFLKTLFNH
jgi:hypothetical protein